MEIPIGIYESKKFVTLCVNSQIIKSKEHFLPASQAKNLRPRAILDIGFSTSFAATSIVAIIDEMNMQISDNLINMFSLVACHHCKYIYLYNFQLYIDSKLNFIYFYAA